MREPLAFIIDAKLLNRKMEKILLILIIFCTTQLSKAQSDDNLEPAESIYTSDHFQREYFEYLTKYFLSDLSEFPIARIYVFPSFHAEYIISIERNDSLKNNKDDIFFIYKTCEPSIWAKFVRDKRVKEENNDVDDINLNVKVVRFKIDSSFARTINKLFRVLLFKAKFPNNIRMGVDGTTYYYMSSELSNVFGFGTRCGKMWSPENNTLMHQLQIITELMKEFGETKNIKVKLDIIKRTRHLTTQIENPKKKLTYEFDIIKILLLISTTIIFVLIFVLIKFCKK